MWQYITRTKCNRRWTSGDNIVNVIHVYSMIFLIENSNVFCGLQ